MLTLTLPWPARELHPNGRIIWQAKQNHIRLAREEANYFTRAAAMPLPVFTDSLTITYTFCPPNKVKRDLDNLVANMKPALDGIMDALQANDSQIVEISARWGDVVKGGSVDVVLSEQSADDKLRAELSMYQWIPVGDRLPVVGHNLHTLSDDVLVYNGDDEWMAVAFYDTQTGTWQGSGVGFINDVTHWMPLPEPPALEVQP